MAFKERLNGRRRERVKARAPLLAVALLLCACGAKESAMPEEPAAGSFSTADNFDDDTIPVDAAGVRDHGLIRAALGLWWGSGCPRFGACGCGTAKDLGQEFTCQMDRLQAADLPVSVYLFDGSAWSATDSSVTGACSGPDCCSWKLGDPVISRLSKDRVRALVHFWGGCHRSDQYQRVQSKLGRNLLGFYMDDGSSDEELQGADDFMRSVAPGDFENVAKSYQNRQPSTTNAGLSLLANVGYVGDLTNDFEGMREGISRLFTKSRLLPAPMNELTSYAFDVPSGPDEESFYRRLHYGAFQPIMAHTPFANSDPWRPEYSPDLLSTYRFYAWLHRELTPFFMSYAIRMHERPGLPVIRAGTTPYTMRVGNEIFVPLVTSTTRALDFRLPAGQWVDYWNEQRVVSGDVVGQPAELGFEPIFLRLGSIIPMEVQRDYTGHGTRESAGSLTVLVYPGGTSTFRYYDDVTGVWTTFRSVRSDDRLTLTAEPATRLPLLYRIARTSTRPTSVGVDDGVVSVNQSGDLPEAGSERQVNGANSSTWFYDPAAQRLIIKVFP
ncbi:MAG: hypothetical protein JJE39_17860 [Vicinamibacteria bacterium]|nr:hypothetical protein [Vicinamibacteria bacterium]